MKLTLKKEDVFRPFMIVILAALLVQFAGRYFAARYLIIGDHFYSLWLILRIGVPVAVIFILKIPFNEIGLGRPHIDHGFGRALLVMAALLAAAFAGIYFYQGYFASYGGSFSSGGQGAWGRFVNFMVFTLSTLTGWEFLHRGFLLMGLFFALSKWEKTDPATAALVSVAVVWVFEVVFHFTKPMLEPVGLLIGSPILSYIALRTGSIWIPFFAHLSVEILFIMSLIFR